MMADRFAGEASSLASEYPFEEVVHEGRVRGGLATAATTTATATTTGTAVVVRRGAWGSGRSCSGCQRTNALGHCE